MPTRAELVFIPIVTPICNARCSKTAAIRVNVMTAPSTLVATQISNLRLSPTVTGPVMTLEIRTPSISAPTTGWQFLFQLQVVGNFVHPTGQRSALMAVTNVTFTAPRPLIYAVQPRHGNPGQMFAIGTHNFPLVVPRSGLCYYGGCNGRTAPVLVTFRSGADTRVMPVEAFFAHQGTAAIIYVKMPNFGGQKVRILDVTITEVNGTATATLPRALQLLPLKVPELVSVYPRTSTNKGRVTVTAVLKNFPIAQGQIRGQGEGLFKALFFNANNTIVGNAFSSKVALKGQEYKVKTRI